MPVIMSPLLAVSLLCSPLIGGGIKRCFCLTSDVCLTSYVCQSRISGLTREQRGLGRLKLAQGSPTSHVTRIPLSRSKDQRLRSPGRFTHCGLNASGSCSGERGNVLGVVNYCYVAVCSAALGASAPTDGGEGRGIPWRPPAYSLLHAWHG